MKNEIDSKRLLSEYGIVTTQPKLVRTASEAAQAAIALGGKVVLKIVSADIVHKAAVGGVRLNVSPAEVPTVFQSILATVHDARPDARLDGVLLEPMVAGEVEVFVGARNDPQYGCVVLLGLGGLRVEYGPKPGAALAPLDEHRAERLIEKGLGALAASLGSNGRRRLRDILMAVAGKKGLMLEASVAEIDINPIMLSEENAIAVDAVVVETAKGSSGSLSDARSVSEAATRRRKRLRGLEALFRPESIALIGASTNTSKLGYRIIRNHLDFGFSGKIYPIHPSAPEICNLPAYPSIGDVPGPVDRAYVAVTAAQVPGVLADCARKAVKVVQVLTAGFSEWSGGEAAAQARELESQIMSTLATTPMRMVGPNCLGTFSAAGRLALGAPRYCPTEPGAITFITQSGTFAGDMVRRAQVLGLPVGQVLSCGNCADLDIVDYLLFCEDDAQTELIVFYIESLRDPALFFRLAATARKPIIVLRGGATEQGLAAASSHTAALATDQTLWRAAVEQAGILEVNGIEPLLDVLTVFAAHRALNGERLGIFGSGGGVSVTATDTAAANGLVVPPLAGPSVAGLARFGVPGTSVANPIDIPVWGLRDGKRYILEEVINLLKSDPNLDSIVVYVETGSVMDFADTDADGLRQLSDICQSIARAQKTGPKVSAALRSSGDKLQDDFVREQRALLMKAGVAVFSSTARAVRAHAALWQLTRGTKLRARPQES